ncbi:MAG TPA: hypothetical protein VK784_06315 [Pseudonocardiaceae bacterium]|nr:hypothetical protein [Pseudonocardiaceae bacterium]
MSNASTSIIGFYELATTRYCPYEPDGGAGELWFLDPWSGSWASTWWTEHGRPDEQDWIFTVHADGQSVDLT